MPYRLYKTRETKPSVRNNDVLLITGDGKNLVEDLETFNKFGVEHDKLCIGRSIAVVDQPIIHYVDVDSDAGKWVCENLSMQYPGKVNGKLIRHTMGAEEDAPWFDNTWDLKGSNIPAEEAMWYGSSAFFAVLIGIEMGYKRIVLAGCPLDSKGHWYFKNETYGPKWTGPDYQVWFEFAAGCRAYIVRSLSGYTRILLNEPDRSWLNGITKRPFTV